MRLLDGVVALADGNAADDAGMLVRSELAQVFGDDVAA